MGASRTERNCPSGGWESGEVGEGLPRVLSDARRNAPRQQDEGSNKLFQSLQLTRKIYEIEDTTPKTES